MQEHILKKETFTKWRSLLAVYHALGAKERKILGDVFIKMDWPPVLEGIRKADGLIIGSPNYLGDVRAVAAILHCCPRNVAEP